MTGSARQKRHQARLREAGGAVVRLRLRPATVIALDAICSVSGRSREYVLNELAIAYACGLQVGQFNNGSTWYVSGTGEKKRPD